MVESKQPFLCTVRFYGCSIHFKMAVPGSQWCMTAGYEKKIVGQDLSLSLYWDNRQTCMPLHDMTLPGNFRAGSPRPLHSHANSRYRNGKI